MPNYVDIEGLQLINASLVQGVSATIITAYTTLVNGGLYRLRYRVTFTDATGAEAVFLQIGAAGGVPAPITYPVLTRAGDVLTVGRLRSRETLCFRFLSPNSTSANVSPHFTVLNRLYPQYIVTPEVLL